MNLNLKGLFFLSQAVARLMKEQGEGKIINVASVVGITPNILPVYSISKAGVIMAKKSDGLTAGSRKVNGYPAREQGYQQNNSN